MSEKLKQLRKKTGMTQQEFADHIGMSYGGWMKIEQGSRGLSRNLASKLAKLFHIRASDLYDDALEEAPTPDNEVEVVGEVQAGHWLDVHEAIDEPIAMLPCVKDSRYAHLRHFAYRVHGDSFDRIVGDGGYVVCVSFAESGLAITPGMPVVVEQRRDGGSLIQRTLKRVKANPDGGWLLVPESTNPIHKPIIFEGEETTASITGLVVQTINFPDWNPY